MLSDDDVAEIRRLAKTCTQAQIAARKGVGTYTVSKILNGKRHGKPNWLKLFARLLPTRTTTEKGGAGKKNLDALAAKAKAKLPLFDESDYPTGLAGTRAGIPECDLFSVRRAGVDVEEPK